MHHQVKRIYSVECLILKACFGSRCLMEIDTRMTGHGMFHHLETGIESVGGITSQSASATCHLEAFSIGGMFNQLVKDASLLIVDKLPIAVVKPALVILIGYGVVVINDFIIFLCHNVTQEEFLSYYNFAITIDVNAWRRGLGVVRATSDVKP